MTFSALYETRFMRLWEEAAIKDRLPEVDRMIATYNIYLQEYLDKKSDIIIMSDYIYKMLVLCCPMDEKTIEKLISKLDSYKNYNLINEIIKSGKMLPEEILKSIENTLANKEKNESIQWNAEDLSCRNS